MSGNCANLADMNAKRYRYVFQLVLVVLAFVIIGKGLVHSLATTLAKPVSERLLEEDIANIVLWMDGVFELAEVQPFEESGEDSESEKEVQMDWEDEFCSNGSFLIVTSFIDNGLIHSDKTRDLRCRALLESSTPPPEMI